VKILMLGNTPPPVGGAEMHTELLSRRLAELGNEMHILRWKSQYYTTKNGTELVAWEQPGMAVQGVFMHPLLTPADNYTSETEDARKETLKRMLRARRMISAREIGMRNALRKAYYKSTEILSRTTFLMLKTRPDIIHVQDLQHSGPALPRYRRLKAGLVATAHYGGIYDLENWSEKRRKEIREAIMRADALICVSNRIRERLLEGYGIEESKTRAIPNPVDTEMFKPMGLEKENKIICVSRLEKRKGIEHLITAMPKIARQTGLKLEIIGEGPEEHTLRKHADKLGIAKQVSFKGGIAHDRIPHLLNKAKMLVQPSLSEGQPISIIEAMCCKCPVVGTRIEGVDELIKDKKTGLLAEKASPEGLAERIMELAGGRKLREKITENAFKKATREHDSRSIAKQTNELYAGLKGRA